MLRVMLGVNFFAALGALVSAPRLALWPEACLELAAMVEPLMLAGLGCLIALRDLLRRLPVRLGQICVLLLVGALSFLYAGFALRWGFFLVLDPWRAGMLAMCIAALMLAYFELRAGAVSPAQSEARLAALNARIRPHFLFNTLNTVLSLIRSRPQQAEEALEALADLFRAAMRDPGMHSSLADELAIARQYLDLERLRLGERLRVVWQVDDVPLDVGIPPLMLQPLLENAVYHGIEPLPEGGEIHVHLHQGRDELSLAVSNPMAANRMHAPGNQMALANIRERLALYYDLEARLEIRADQAIFEVRIVLPCRKHP